MMRSAVTKELVGLWNVPRSPSLIADVLNCLKCVADIKNQKLKGSDIKDIVCVPFLIAYMWKKPYFLIIFSLLFFFFFK